MTTFIGRVGVPELKSCRKGLALLRSWAIQGLRTLRLHESDLDIATPARPGEGCKSAPRPAEELPCQTKFEVYAERPQNTAKWAFSCSVVRMATSLKRPRPKSVLQRLLSLACDAPAAAMGPEADARPCPTSTALPFFAMLVRAQFLWSGTPAHWPGLETSYLICSARCRAIFFRGNTNVATQTNAYHARSRVENHVQRIKDQWRQDAAEVIFDACRFHPSEARGRSKAQNLELDVVNGVAR